jgi:SHS2 domain-containing protein
MRYKLIDHTADFGIHVFGENSAELFEHAALIMFELIVESTPSVECRQSLISVEGSDWPDLMVNWLRELLYLWTGSGKILRSIAFEELAEHGIIARVEHVPFQPDQHGILNDIKAVTYHHIQAGPVGDLWEAKIIFDI